jgi:hypothetical protein
MKKIQSPKILLFFFSVLLAGCAAPLQLRQDSGEYVNLKLRQSMNANYAEGFFSAYLDDYDCYGFSVPAAAKASYFPIDKRISVAGRQFLTIFTGHQGYTSGGIKSCDLTLTFEVKPEGTYVINMGNSGKECMVMVEEEGVGAIELHKREFTRPFSDGNGPWCKADPKFIGSSSLLKPRG